MANEHYANEFLDQAARAAVSSTIISKKGNVCPFAVRLAWHASGTYDAYDTNPATAGGSDGATMRFPEECSDGANAGLALMQEILKPVKKQFPNMSYADLWTMAGTQAVKLVGGPDVPFRYGRKDHPDSTTCPPNGRLPDAAQGAQHLRDVFYRMGFDDKAIVALSGAHTLGSCHRLRSGFDGPWTTNPLKFDNEYFKNLLELKWTKRMWDGPEQYEDPSGKLMMLPTDMALIEDEKFLPYVKLYAADEQAFFKDFAEAFGALIAKGCPAHCQTNAPIPEAPGSTPDKEFRDLAMHGSVERMKQLVADTTGTPINVNSAEEGSGRTAAHKASFFGHAHVIEYLATSFADIDFNIADSDGDTPLHDAARFGHMDVVTALLKAPGIDKYRKNNKGKTAHDLAVEDDKMDVAALLIPY